MSLRRSLSVSLLTLALSAGPLLAQGATVGKAVLQTQQAAQQSAGKADGSTAAALGTKDAPSAKAPQGTDKTSSSKPATAGENAASAQTLKLGPLDPSKPPTGLPTNRPVIGLAMGGGAALAFTEIGTLQWFEEHHIPVDVIAGTSMGSILGALYSTGHTPDQMKHILNDSNVNRIFRISSDYAALNYRSREDNREIPSGISVGLKHGVSLRNSLLTDTGLNELLDREFLRYNDQTDFNNLPIPFRCQATDLNAARTVTFARGSLQDAVRASASIPGVFRPFQLNGHEYVDGAILENLPTDDVKAMGADVIIAISLPLAPVGKGDLDSILGVLQRAFAVGIEANEERGRKLANILIMPDIKGFTANDYLATNKLAERGYAAAEAHKAELMKYALSDADWDAYVANKKSKERLPAGDVIQVKVKAPTRQVAAVTQTVFKSLIGKPVDVDEIEKKLAIIRSDGRYDVDYTVGYDTKDSENFNPSEYKNISTKQSTPSDGKAAVPATPGSVTTSTTSATAKTATVIGPNSASVTPVDATPESPIVLVSVNDKKTGPPFLTMGVNIEAQTGGDTRATFATILKWQDLGGYGSGLRVKFDLGFLTRLEGEYYWKPMPLGHFFLAPRANITRRPYYIYDTSGYRLSERQSQFTGGGGDAGWTDGKYQEFRAGWLDQYVIWKETTGFDGLPNYNNNSQVVRGQYIFDNQDRALVPRYGLRAAFTGGYLYGTAGSVSAPQFTGELDYAHTFSKKNLFLIRAEGGTLFDKDVAQPFRFTLGGPLHLAASAIDQYRGTDYFLATPGYLRRIATLPAPLGQSIYLGATYEIGQMRSPDGANVMRQDVYFGLVAETPLGVVTLAPAIGDHGERKFVFTLGRFF